MPDQPLFCLVTPEDYAEHSRAPATRRAYAADWADFAAWCASAGLAAVPAAPETIGRYLATRAATLRPATLDRRLAAIAGRHRDGGHPCDLRHPAIAQVRRGIRRALGTAPAQKAALTAGEIAGVVAVLPDTLAGRRDRALILLGFAAALRRSELAALDCADVTFAARGATLRVRRSKEDQEGGGRLTGLPRGARPQTCPVAALKAWLIAARLGDGPLFRPVDRHGNLGTGGLSGEAVAGIVKRAVAAAAVRDGLSAQAVAARVEAVAGHSLRAGFVTSAAAAGASEWEIMRHTGHRQAATVRRYIRLGDVFTDNLAGKLGL